VARKPSRSKFASGVELNWSARIEQWWFVAISPPAETNEAEQPPKLTIDASSGESGSESSVG